MAGAAFDFSPLKLIAKEKADPPPSTQKKVENTLGDKGVRGKAGAVTPPPKPPAVAGISPFPGQPEAPATEGANSP